MIRQVKILAALGAMTFVGWTNSVQAATIVSSTHPGGVYHGFSGGPIPFEAFSVPGGVTSGARFALDNGALKITNAYAGSFSVDTKLKPFNADQLGHLYFDYKLTPDVKVNLFFRVNGDFHGVTFSGPNTVRPGSLLIGQVAGVKADGQWHRAHIPLRDWLRKVHPLAPTLDVDMAVIGNWDNNGWLMAGMGGNGPGTSWWIDNFALVGTGPGQAKFELRDDAGAALPNAAGTQWMLDNQKAGAGATLAADAKDGLHTIEARDAAGKVLAGYAIYAASGSPKIGAARLSGNTLRVPVNAPAGLKVSGLKLTVEGREFTPSSTYMEWDGASDELLLDAAAAGFQWKDGAQVPVKLTGVADVQNRTAPDWQGNVTVNYAEHKAAPAMPRVKIEGLAAPRPAPDKRDAEVAPLTIPAPIFGAGDGSFEDDMDEWASEDPKGTDAILERDNTTAASGRYSLRLTSPANAVRFRATIRSSGFDAAKVPIVSFDYKIPPQLRVDFMVLFDGTAYDIQFTDKDNPLARIGAVPNVIADNQWHHAEFNLGKMLRDLKPGRSEYRVDEFYIGDGQWLGNARGVQYWVDNFKFVPLTKGSPLRAEVTAGDVTGLKGVAWALDENPNTKVPETVTTPVKGNTPKIEVTGSGRKWLHVRVQNSAGQWSAQEDVPLWLSDNVPQIAQNEIAPAPGARVVPASLDIPVRVEGGLVNDSIKLTVGGREYTTQDAALRYDGDGNKIVWDAAQALQDGHIKVPANGDRIDWKLAPVRDFLEQEAPAVEGNWINDFAGDKIGPRIQLISETHETLIFDDGTDVPNNGDESLTWKAGDGAVVENIERDGGRARRFTSTTEGGAFSAVGVLPNEMKWDARKFGIVSFDYRIPPQANIAMRLRFSNGRSWIAILAGEKPSERAITIPGIVADNQWHTATFNVVNLMRDQNQGMRNPIITDIEFRDMLLKTPANVAWELDNFLIQQAGGSTAKLGWRAHDLSGVKNYRFVWDQKPASTPEGETQETARTVEGSSGLWFAHVQAQDGAGNWGPPSHVPIVTDAVTDATVTPPATPLATTIIR